MKIKRAVKLAILTTVFACLPLSVYADFKGHHATGGWGLQSGTQSPSPGSFLFSPNYSRYSADRLLDHKGNNINLSGKDQKLTVNSVGLFGWWVSHYKVLGANWGMSATVFASDNSIEYAAYNLEKNFDLADVFIQPINLGWHLKQADFMVTYGIYIPTGKYSDGADDNTGLGMWTHEFGAGTTYYFDKRRKWHISAMGYFEIHSEKEDSDTQVGNILTLEGGIGRSWYDGALTAGLAYYAQWKLSSDKIGLNTTNPNLPSSTHLDKSRLYGLGPEVNIPIFVDDKIFCILTGRYQWEFGARSTLEGQNLNMYVNFLW